MKLFGQFLEEVFSETEMSVNPPAINIQSIVLRRRRNVLLQPFLIVSRRERREEGCNAAPCSGRSLKTRWRA